VGRSVEEQEMRSEGTVLVSAFLGILWWVVVAVVAAAATEFSPPPPPPNSASTLRAEHQGYRVTAVNEFADGSGFVAALELIKPSETYGADIKQLSMVVRNEEDELLHVHISDSLNPRWEVPQELIQRPVPLSLLHVNKDQNTLLQHHRNLNSQVPESQGELDSTSLDHLLQFSYTSGPFGFSITRISTGEVLFNSTPVAASSSSDDDDHGVIDDIVQSFSFNSMVFKDQYLEISTQMPKTTSLFGLGESTKSKLQLTRGRTYTLWATDIGADNVDIDLYGAFPFYMDVRRGGASHGVLLLNSNGMDVDVNEDFLTYHIIGGVLDFYFFAGPSPLAVVDQYTKLIGRPAPMPFWSFGKQQF
jgi:alpha-glucosidase/alpha-D-xyloside xylohydrolase